MEVSEVTVEGMVRGVAQAAAFILVLTTGVWRPFVVLEVRAAILLKKKILLSKGIPEEALRITVVLDEHSEGHAVLTLTSAAGDYILDNRRNEIRAWADTGYTMLKRQSAQDPRKWVSLEPARSQSMVDGTASK